MSIYNTPNMARIIQYFLQVWASDINNLGGTTNTSHKKDIRDIKKEDGLYLWQRKLSICVFMTSPVCRNLLG
jgi:hypothetical protein